MSLASQVLMGLVLGIAAGIFLVELERKDGTLRTLSRHWFEGKSATQPLRNRTLPPP